MTMNLTKTIYTQLTDTTAIIQDIQETCKQIDPEYGKEEAKFQSAVAFLEENLSRELVPAFRAYLNAMEEAFGAAVLFLGCQGLRLNLDIFRQPANAALLREDFEELHQEYRLPALPAVQKAQVAMAAFQEAAKALPQTQSDCLGQIVDYYAYLKTLGYKLAHYLGFRFGEAFFPGVIPGYVCSCVHTNQYQMALEAYLQLDLSSLALDKC